MKNEELKNALHHLTVRIVRGALAIYKKDPHKFSARPCSTCEQITELLGEPYGCVEQAKKQFA